METQIGKFLLLILAVITFGCSEKGISSVNDTTSESAVIDLDEAPEEIELELGVYEDKDCSHWFGDTPCNMVFLRCGVLLAILLPRLWNKCQLIMVLMIYK